MTDLPFPMDPEELAELIDIPLDEWPGNCHGVAFAILELVPVKGMRLCRGHYHGYISENSVYNSRSFSQHSWLELEDGRILDPTRWAFSRSQKPFIFLGLNESEYDEYGALIKARTPPMIGLPGEHLVPILKRLTKTQFERIFPGSGRPDSGDDRTWFRFADQLDSWLGDVPEHLDDAKSLYSALADSGNKALIQLDMWISVMTPDKVTCGEGKNRYFEMPPAPEMTETDKLLRIFNQFLCIEDRPCIEEELEEIGYELERDLWSSLNTLERFKDLEIKLLPNVDNCIDTVSLVACELLGRGHGKALEVERYARSQGIDIKGLESLLERFGNRVSIDLRW